MLLPLFNPHLNKEPDDQTHEGGFDQGKQPGPFSPSDAQGIVDGATVLNHSVAHRMFFSVAKHVDANHGGEPIAQLPKDHAQHHGVGKQRSVGQEFHWMVCPLIRFIFPLLDADMPGQYAGGIARQLQLPGIFLPHAVKEETDQSGESQNNPYGPKR